MCVSVCVCECVCVCVCVGAIDCCRLPGTARAARCALSTRAGSARGSSRLDKSVHGGAQLTARHPPGRLADAHFFLCQMVCADIDRIDIIDVNT